MSILLITALSGTAAAATTCPTTDQLAELSEFVDVLAVNASLIAGHASPRETVGTLALPGWNVAPATFAWLARPCDGPKVFDPYCDGDVCWQIECIEPGASWIQHATLDGTPRTQVGWRYGSGFTDVTWIDGGSRLKLRLGGQARDAAGQDYSFDGAERLLTDRVEMALRFPALLGTGEVIRAYARVDFHTGAPEGVLLVDGVEVAQLVDAGGNTRWVGSGACP